MMNETMEREDGMKVSDLMLSKGSRIVMVRMNETLEMAARLLRRENIGALVVKDVVRTEGNTPVGMFSERDVVQAIVVHGAAALKIPVSKLMTRTVVSCGLKDDLDDVFKLMEQHHIRHVPVFEPHGVVGVVSLRDILPYRTSTRALRVEHEGTSTAV